MKFEGFESIKKRNNDDIIAHEALASEMLLVSGGITRAEKKKLSRLSATDIILGSPIKILGKEKAKILSQLSYFVELAEHKDMLNQKIRKERELFEERDKFSRKVLGKKAEKHLVLLALENQIEGIEEKIKYLKRQIKR